MIGLFVVDTQWLIYLVDNLLFRIILSCLAANFHMKRQKMLETKIFLLKSLMGASALHGKYFLNMTRFPPVFTYNLSIHFNEVFSRVHMVEGNPSYLIFYLYMHDEH